MKKVIALALSLTMALGLVACGSNDAPAASSGAASTDASVSAPAEAPAEAQRAR